MTHIFLPLKNMSVALAVTAILTACSTAGSPSSGQLSNSKIDAPNVCPEKKIITSTAEYDALTFDGFGDNFAAFHKANGKRDGVVTTPSGLQYTVVKKGLKNGTTPAVTDKVTVHYHGYFANGDVFDSSYQRGRTIDFPTNAVITGWVEALQDMTVCEARTLYIPGNLAYGRKGASGIPPNSTLLFDVQLLAVK